MTNDQGFSLKYRLGMSEDDSNLVYQKMKEGNFMLSPYAQWALKLEVDEKFLAQFAEQLSTIEIHLKGTGQYVLVDKTKDSKWDLHQFASSVFVRSSPSAASNPASPQYVKRDPDYSYAPKLITQQDDASQQKTNYAYLYSATDIHFIVQSPTVKKELEGMQFIQGLQADHLDKKVEEIFSYASQGKPVLCVYNLSNVHWVVFTLVKGKDGKFFVLYKDSFGSAKTELANLLRSKKVEFKHHRGTEQQGDGTSCGILALENMRMMAKELRSNADKFVGAFETHVFCTLEKARQLRLGSFLDFYIAGVSEQARTEALHAQKAQQLRDAHQPEIVKICDRLSESVPKGINVAMEKVTDARRTIVVEIGADNQNFDTYHYRIAGTEDIQLEELQKILKDSHFAWDVSDYRIEDGIIKIFKKLQ